jgi:hypothetical protein
VSNSTALLLSVVLDTKRHPCISIVWLILDLDLSVTFPKDTVHSLDAHPHVDNVEADKEIPCLTSKS